jgi:hypothetical protein
MMTLFRSKLVAIKHTKNKVVFTVFTYLLIIRKHNLMANFKIMSVTEDYIGLKEVMNWCRPTLQVDYSYFQ